MGRETDLPSTGRKRMEEEGKERKEKEKPGVILVRKKKRQKVKSVFSGGGGCAEGRCECTQALQTKGITVRSALGGSGLY